MKAKIRKIATFVEETRSEMGKTVMPPTRRAAAAAVIENPFAGRYVEDSTELIEIGEELGTLLTERAIAALGIPGPSAESDGKAAAVGKTVNSACRGRAASELGTPVRKVLGKGARPPLCRKSVAARECRLISPWATKTPLTCAAISMEWRFV